MADWNYAGPDFFCHIAVPHADEVDVVHRDEHVLAYRHTRPFC
jgi:histidine triad (HIT) family protein